MTRYAVWASPRTSTKLGKRLGIKKTSSGKKVVWMPHANQRTFTKADLALLRRFKITHPRHKVTVKAINPYPWLKLDTDTRYPLPSVSRKLNAVGRDLNRKLFIREGWRTRARQQELYSEYERRGFAPPIVARPGTSRHETGHAADVGVNPRVGDADGVSLRDFPGGAAAAQRHGLRFTVPSEAWHVEG